MPADRSGAYLAACTIYRDDAAYLAEWIEFHRLMGVERFFLYDNGSTDHHREVLAGYLAEGVATLQEWAAPFLGRNGRPKAIMTAFEHCIGAHRQDARWIAFLDVDEFLFTPDGGSLPEVLSDYEEYPGVVVNRAEFGPSGHVTKPAGLVIESYVQRRPLQPDDESAHKSVVDPSRVTRCLGAHSFMYVDGAPVDEQKRRVDMMRRMRRKPVTWTRLRAHHYWSRSEEERRHKAALWSEVGSPVSDPAAPATGPSAGHPRLLGDAEVVDRAHSVHDDSLAGYGRAVREALARRG
jgi:hypothetical protein